jgi:hypothetical protein
MVGKRAMIYYSLSLERVEVQWDFSFGLVLIQQLPLIFIASD